MRPITNRRDAAAPSLAAIKEDEPMKKISVLLLFLVSNVTLADQYVHGYTRQDGAYVQPYHRSAQNGSRSDNYSSQGNVNPYTGQRGTERNEYSNPPAYNNDPYSNRRDNQ